MTRATEMLGWIVAVSLAVAVAILYRAGHHTPRPPDRPLTEQQRATLTKMQREVLAILDGHPAQTETDHKP